MVTLGKLRAAVHKRSGKNPEQFYLDFILIAQKMNRKNNIKSTVCNEKLFPTDDTYKFFLFHNSKAVKNDAYFGIKICNAEMKRRKRSVLHGVL